ncbi:MAG: MFS transporter [Pseudomonadota bacterium]
MIGLIALCCAYVLSQFFRSFLAVLTPALSTDIGATTADLSIASSAWFLAFAAMQFAVGVGLDRYGPRRTAAWLLGIAGAGGGFLFAYAQTPSMIVLAMALIGIGCSPVLMASLFIFARLYSAGRFALLTSIFIGIGSLGNIGGASPLAAAAEAFGWRSVMAGLAVVTLLIAAAILFWVKDPPKEGDAEDTSFAGYIELLRLKPLWFIYCMMLFNYSVAAGIRGLWAGPYLGDVFGLGVLAIGEVTLFMALAMAIGSFLYGPLDTFFNTRKWVVVGGSVITLGTLTALAVNPLMSVWSISVALVIIGLAGSGFGVIMAHSKAFFPAHLIGRGVTLLNFCAIFGAGLMQYLTGAVVDAYKVPEQPEAAYSALFWFYTAVLGVALVIYLFSKDAKPKTV